MSFNIDSIQVSLTVSAHAIVRILANNKRNKFMRTNNKTTKCNRYMYILYVCKKNRRNFGAKFRKVLSQFNAAQTFKLYVFLLYICNMEAKRLVVAFPCSHNISIIYLADCRIHLNTRIDSNVLNRNIRSRTREDIAVLSLYIYSNSRNVYNSENKIKIIRNCFNFDSTAAETNTIDPSYTM